MINEESLLEQQPSFFRRAISASVNFVKDYIRGYLVIKGLLEIIGKSNPEGSMATTLFFTTAPYLYARVIDYNYKTKNNNDECAIASSKFFSMGTIFSMGYLMGSVGWFKEVTVPQQLTMSAIGMITGKTCEHFVDCKKRY